MAQSLDQKRPMESKVTVIKVTVKEVNRLFKAGVLFSVLTKIMKSEIIRLLRSASDGYEIGNASVP
jgi:hypothetical protein